MNASKKRKTSLRAIDRESKPHPGSLHQEIAGTPGSHFEERITILLVEQNVQEALELADYAYVLQTGRIVMEGKPAELLQTDMIKKAYLGL